MTQRSPTTVHHDTTSAGMAQRSGDFLAAALCQHECHQGPHGVHGDKRRLRAAKVEEADLINDTIAKGFAQMAQVMGHQVGGAPDVEGEAVELLREILQPVNFVSDPIMIVDPSLVKRARQVVGDG